MSFLVRTSAYSDPLIEITYGYLFFGNEKARKAYNRGGENINFAASYPIWDIWHLYGSAGYWERNGRTFDINKLRLQAYPISLGIKPVLPLSCNVQAYFTLGPRYFILNEELRCPDEHRETNKSVLGAFVGTGFLFIPCSGCTFDFSLEYSYLSTHIPCGSCSAPRFIDNLSCISANIGIGISF